MTEEEQKLRDELSATKIKLDLMTGAFLNLREKILKELIDITETLFDEVEIDKLEE